MVSIHKLIAIDRTKKAKRSSFVKEIQRLSWQKWCILFITIILWYVTTPYNNIMIATAFACIFYLVETCFCTLTEPKTQNEWIVWSTPEQFIVNIIFIPILLPLFTYPLSNHCPLVKAVLSPLFIWCLEIIEGYVLILLFGYNRAWQYDGQDAYFHGTIKLSYAPLWILLSIGFIYFAGDVMDSMHPIFAF